MRVLAAPPGVGSGKAAASSSSGCASSDASTCLPDVLDVITVDGDRSTATSATTDMQQRRRRQAMLAPAMAKPTTLAASSEGSLQDLSLSGGSMTGLLGHGQA